MCLVAWLLALGAAWPRASTAADAYSQGLLFRIDAPGRASSWVFGALHSGDPRVVALPATVAAAFAKARSFAPAMPLTPRDLPGFAAAAQFTDEHRLADFFDADAIGRIRTALGRSVPPNTLSRLKPWAVLLLLVEQGVHHGGPTHIDVLARLARERRMRVVGLELADEQIAALDTLPTASAVALVHYLLGRLARLPTDHDALVDAWLARDLRSVAALMGAPGGRVPPELASHVEQMNRHLIENRSVQIAHRLFLPLREGRVFVAVGAAHLPGRTGLLALLRAQGYAVTRVW